MRALSSCRGCCTCSTTGKGVARVVVVSDANKAAVAAHCKPAIELFMANMDGTWPS